MYEGDDDGVWSEVDDDFKFKISYPEVVEESCL